MGVAKGKAVNKAMLACSHSAPTVLQAPRWQLGRQDTLQSTYRTHRNKILCLCLVFKDTIFFFQQHGF